MAASREPVVVGLLATEGLPADIADDIAEELRRAGAGAGITDAGRPPA